MVVAPQPLNDCLLGLRNGAQATDRRKESVVPVFESSSETDFAMKRDDLWRLMTDESTARRWLTSSRPIAFVPPGILAKGTTIEMAMDVGPWHRTSIRTISEFVPPSRLAFTGFGGTITFDLDTTNSGTTVTVRRSQSMGGALGFARRLARIVVPVRGDPVADMYLTRMLRPAGEM